MLSLNRQAAWSAGVAVTLALAACAPDLAPSPTAVAALTVEASAAAWKPIVASDLAALRPAPPAANTDPQTLSELGELRERQAKRTDATRATIAYWNAEAAPLRWSELSREKIVESGQVPPRAARSLAIVHTAMYDAVVAAWDAKGAYQRARPAQLDARLSPLAGDEGVPSYPSEHAAIAYAAAYTLGYVFPEDKEQFLAKAAEAASSRLDAGANLASDIEAGKRIGAAVAERVIARAGADGSDAAAELPLKTQPGQWTHTSPMEPLAGSWKPWVLASGSELRLSPPLALDTPEMQAETAEVRSVASALTPEQVELAKFWNFDVPAIMWNDRARALLSAKKASTPVAARTLSYLHLATADAFIAAWDTKYQVLRPRPAHVAEGFFPIVTTPPHPSYPSGHAVCSGAAAVYLGAVFPDEAATLTAWAEEAAMSRLWGGIHFRSDNDDGLKLGRAVGARVLARAQAEGRP